MDFQRCSIAKDFVCTWCQPVQGRVCIYKNKPAEIVAYGKLSNFHNNIDRGAAIRGVKQSVVIFKCSAYVNLTP